MISIIIPTNKDPFIFNTLKSLLDNSRSDIEIIPVFDGYTPDKDVQFDSRVKPIYFPTNKGMRSAINAGLAKAKGKYIMKCDSHCSFAKGFDKVLSENCADNWLLIPRRYSLDSEKWKRNMNRRAIDYHYLQFPTESANYGLHLSNLDWHKRTSTLTSPKYAVDDTMSFQGSCWFANKKYFMKRVGHLDNRKQTYGEFADEPQEIGLKYWLGGGENKVIKKTWYAHLVKRPHHYRANLFARDYKLNEDAKSGHTWSAIHWMNNREPKMKHELSWLIEKFWPVPSWPEDRSLWKI